MPTRKRKKKKQRHPLRWIGFILVLVIAISLFRQYRTNRSSSPEPNIVPTGQTEPTVSSPKTSLAVFAKENGLRLADWPSDLVVLLERNPDATDFVLNYPLKKDLEFDIDLREHLRSDTVPLLLQWDQRWGYTEYSGNVMGLTGCGPTCLSMVCIYLLDDARYTPKYVAAFAEENGYAIAGNGSSWTLISEGGKKLGLDVTEIPLVESRIIKNLEAGNPIICVVGPGFFTTTGHYIVMTGYENGYVRVNDPNSPTKSEQTWKLTEVMEQIRNLWVCS